MLDESVVARSESGGSVSHIVGYGLLVFLSQLSGALQKVFHAQCQFLRIEPKSVIRPQCSKNLAIALFPNIFYFLVGILPVFVT